MGWRIRVRHSTGYRYDTPVHQSYNEVRLTPRTDSRQNVIVSRVETTPATRLYRYTDYWGTAVTAFDLHAPHKELAVVATSVVETADIQPPVATAAWPDLATDEVRDRHTEMLEFTAYVGRDKELAKVSRVLRKEKTPVEAVHAAARWVHEHLTYQPGSTGVHTSALEAGRPARASARTTCTSHCCSCGRPASRRATCRVICCLTVSGRCRNYIGVRLSCLGEGEAPSLRVVVPAEACDDPSLPVRDRVVSRRPGRAGAARPGLHRAVPPGDAGEDRAAGRRRAGEHGDRRPARRRGAAGVQVAQAVLRGGPGRPGSRPRTGRPPAFSPCGGGDGQGAGL